MRADEVEILVAREVRKAGLELSKLAVRSRHAIATDDATDDASGYVMELRGITPVGDGTRDVLIEFRNEAELVGSPVVEALATRAVPPRVAEGPKRLQPIPAPPPAAESAPPLRLLLSTSGFDDAAVRKATTLGIVLLRIADGGAAFLRSQWAMGDQPPAWVPEYMAELVDLGPSGEVRHQMLVSGKSKLAAIGVRP